MMPSLSSAPQAIAAAQKTFGVALSSTVMLLYKGGEHEDDYCQTPKQPYDTCPPYAPGKKSISHSAKGSGSDPTFGAKVSYEQMGKSSLGKSTYDQKVSISSKSPTYDSASGQQHFLWEDVMHVNAKSLPSTTPVTISVELSVKQSATKVNCKYDPVADFDYSATGIDKTEPYVEVRGGCVNGKFTYTLGSGSAKGLQDVGVINTNPNAAIEISGTGNIRLHACQLVTSCAKSYSSEIAGAVTWRIRKISPAGVTVSTDSGTNYRK